MTAMVLAIFVASVVGSLHCVGMCGAFVAIACGGTEPSLRRAVSLQCAYHGGRLVTYLVFGAIAGAMGQMLNLAGAMAGIEPVAAMLAGGFMVLFALVTLANLKGWTFLKFSPPAFMVRWLGRGHRAAMALSPVSRAGAIGLLTTLLPCGWLYAFVITAAGTAHPLKAVLVMFIFWLGTLPILVTLGAGVQKITGTLGRKLPVATCLLLLAMGLYTLIGRSFLNPVAIAQQTHGVTDSSDVEEPSCCKE